MCLMPWGSRGEPAFAWADGVSLCSPPGGNHQHLCLVNSQAGYHPYEPTPQPVSGLVSHLFMCVFFPSLGL